MTPLLDAIYLYADKELMPRYQKEDEPWLQQSRARYEQYRQVLKGLGGEAWASFRKLETEGEYISGYEKAAVFQAGVSIGLELGRL